MYDERFAELLNYYNQDKGTELPAEPDFRFPYRAVCANIAWCMLNKDRFWEYYNKSEYWQKKLISAIKHFGMRPFINGYLDNRLYEQVNFTFGKRFIVRPAAHDLELDITTVHNILAEGVNFSE